MQPNNASTHAGTKREREEKRRERVKRRESEEKREKRREEREKRRERYGLDKFIRWLDACV